MPPSLWCCPEDGAPAMPTSLRLERCGSVRCSTCVSGAAGDHRLGAVARLECDAQAVRRSLSRGSNRTTKPAHQGPGGVAPAPDAVLRHQAVTRIAPEHAVRRRQNAPPDHERRTPNRRRTKSNGLSTRAPRTTSVQTCAPLPAIAGFGRENEVVLLIRIPVGLPAGAYGRESWVPV